MKEMYSTVGLFKLNADGKNKYSPSVLLRGNECKLDMQEMTIWSILHGRILTEEELRECYEEKQRELGLIFSRSFDETLKRLFVRGLISSGKGETEEEAVYNLVSSLYIIPLHQNFFIRFLSFLRLWAKYKVPFGKAKILFEKDKKTKDEKMVMILAFQSLLCSAEIIKCIENDILYFEDDDELVNYLYQDDLTTIDNISEQVRNFKKRNEVITAIVNLYLRKQIIFERV